MHSIAVRGSSIAVNMMTARSESCASALGTSSTPVMFRMPNMTGVELVPKALAQDSDLAVIMLTAIDEPRTAIECMKLGAYDYLIKPVDLDELEMSLQGALRLRQLEIDRRQLEQWLAREVAVRTRDLEERTTVAEEVALSA